MEVHGVLGDHDPPVGTGDLDERVVGEAVLADAVESDLVPSNVASRAHVPKHNPDAPVAPRRLTYWDEDQTRRFLAATADDPLHGLWRVALGTDMRRGELLGLRWEDVDLTNLQLRVTTSLTEVDGVLQLGQPKTGRARG